MTTPYRRVARCQRCGANVRLEDEIADWIRNHPQLKSCEGFTFMDKDLVCHRFKTNGGRDFQCIMFVEFKSFNRQLEDTQRDTMHMVNQMFRTDRTTPTKKAKQHTGQTPKRVWSQKSRQWVKVKAFGYHLVTLSGRTPEDSSRIIWDKREIVEEQLVALLQFNLDPDTLRPIDWRSHHRKQTEAQLDLQ